MGGVLAFSGKLLMHESRPLDHTDLKRSRMGARSVVIALENVESPLGLGGGRVGMRATRELFGCSNATKATPWVSSRPSCSETATTRAGFRSYDDPIEGSDPK